jgi:hypothetical protein
LPYTLSLGAVGGTGADAGQASVSARVQNIKGNPLAGVMVTFTTDAGTLSSASVLTGSGGIASTTVTAATSAGITATAGTLTSRTTVASQPVSPPPPTPAPPVPPTSPGALGLSINASTAAVGSTTVFNANTSGSSGASNITWNFGDGATMTGNSPTTGHLYAAIGSYPVTATLRDDTGRSASAGTTATVTAAPPPPTTPTPGPTLHTITAALGCVPSAGSTVCNATITVDGAPATLQLEELIWFWGDGNMNGAGVKPVVFLQNHTYTQRGTYTVMIIAKTSDGASATATKDVIIP